MIKGSIRTWLLDLISLWMIAGLVEAVTYQDFQSLLKASLVLFILQKLVLPVIEILWIPVSLISFGLLKGVPVFLTMSLFVWLDVGYRVGRITIPSVALEGFKTPTLHLGVVSSVILFIVLLHLLQKGMYWILK